MVVEMLVFILVVVLLMVGDCVVIDMVLWQVWLVDVCYFVYLWQCIDDGLVIDG